MEQLFPTSVSRASIIGLLLGDYDISAIAAEHGVTRAALLAAWNGCEESDVGARLREAIARMRAIPGAPAGGAFPSNLDLATDGGLELVGLFANPLTTTALLLGRSAPPLSEAARAIDPSLSLAAFTSRVFRVFAVQLPSLAEPLSNAAAALERA